MANLSSWHALPQGRTTPAIKNDRVRHDFAVTGGYDPAEDGPESRWGRVEITCPRCGEKRRVGISPAEFAMLTGCVRKGPVEPWQPGDLLDLHGYLDRFVKILPDGLVLTHNLGGRYSQSPVSDLKPILGAQLERESQPGDDGGTGLRQGPPQDQGVLEACRRSWRRLLHGNNLH